ncbi:transthyretin-like family domain-containing protein [Ditylenchus destructor]|uniref:Transthyretin-like family domain-containing protein n=1 Tax=Ditylenchus destructor TaxID=166010 RepID=A0AAD4R2C1_9BILA|nr:transthyretin-like family domain-containing protein [Ditylenchus destructor]
MRASLFCTAVLTSAFVLSQAWAETQNINVAGQVFCVDITETTEQPSLATTSQPSTTITSNGEDSNEVLDPSHGSALKILRKKRNSGYESGRHGSEYHQKPARYDHSGEYQAKPVYRPKQKKPAYEEEEHSEPSYSKMETSVRRPQKPSHHESNEEYGSKPSYHQKPRYQKEEEEYEHKPSYQGSKQKYGASKPGKYEEEGEYERPSKYQSSKPHSQSPAFEQEKPRSRKPSHAGWEDNEHSASSHGWAHRRKRDADDDDWVRRDMDDDNWPSRVDEDWQRTDSWSDDNPGENNGVRPGGPDEGQEQNQGEYSPQQESDDDGIPIDQDDEDDLGRQPIPSQVNQGTSQAGAPPQNQQSGSSQTQSQSQVQNNQQGWNSQVDNTQQQQNGPSNPVVSGRDKPQESGSWDSNKRLLRQSSQGQQPQEQYNSPTQVQGSPAASAPQDQTNDPQAPAPPANPPQEGSYSQSDDPQAPAPPANPPQEGSYSQSDDPQAPAPPANPPQEGSYSQSDDSQSNSEQDVPPQNPQENPYDESQVSETQTEPDVSTSQQDPNGSQGQYQQGSADERADDDGEWQFIGLDGPQNQLAHASRFRRSAAGRSQFRPKLIPAKAEVQLFEHDKISSDDLLATVQTDDQGFFNISGKDGYHKSVLYLREK